MKVASAMTTTHARVRAIAGTLAVVLCAAAMFCARFAGARGGHWEGAGGSGSESETLAFEGFGRVARAALGNLAVGAHPGYGKDDRVGMYGREGEGVEGGGEDGWTVRTTMFMRAAKVLACASAACAVAAVSAVGEPEGVSKAHVGGVAKATSPRSVVTKPTTKFKQGDSDGAESPRGVGGGSPRTPGSESGRRGGRSLEEVARAKELAKERKRQARAEQELIAKKEEEDRAEIAALVVQERAKREARRAEEELARRMREKEEARVAEALAASLESVEEEKRKLREQQEQEKEQEREAAEKDTMHSTGSGSGSGSKTSSPRVTNGGGKGGGGGGGEKKSSPPHKGAPAPPRSQGLTLRFIPTPRTSQAAARAASPAVPPPLQGATVTAAATQAPPPPLPPSRPPPLPSGPPPLPAGPPPAYARKVHPTPEPMHPTFGTGVSGDVTMGAMQPLSPRSPSGGIVPPPGFESLAPAAAPSHRADVSADWSHVDSTIASFLESTADTIEDDDPFIMAARSSNYDDIFSARISDVDITPRLPTSSENNHAAKKVGTKVSAQPPLPPTPHPEVLAAVLGDVI